MDRDVRHQDGYCTTGKNKGHVLRTLLTACNQESRNMLAPDSSPVTVSYHLYSVSSGRCRVTIPGRHLEERDGLCIRCQFIRAMGKIQRTHARVPLAHYIKRLTNMVNRRQEPAGLRRGRWPSPASLFHTLTVETRQNRNLGTSQYSPLVICQTTFKSQTSQRASSPVRGES